MFLTNSNSGVVSSVYLATNLLLQNWLYMGVFLNLKPDYRFIVLWFLRDVMSFNCGLCGLKPVVVSE